MQKERYILLSPETTVIERDVHIADNVVIYGNNHILAGTIIGENCILYPNNILQKAEIGKNCTLLSSIVTDSSIGEHCRVGPFAHVHSKSQIGAKCRVGNFVEIKNSKIDDNVKIAHLSYIGDGEIAENCNIGCGVIFCNYDGRQKQKIYVEKNSFIGSNVNLIAPLRVEEGSYICAGTTVSKDVAKESCVIGRVRAEAVAKLTKKYCKKR